MAQLQVTDIEDDDLNRDEHEHSEGDESTDQGFDHGGEQEERKEAREEPGGNKQSKEGRHGEGEDVAQRETKIDDAGEVEEKRAASEEKTTQSVPCGSQQISQDTLAASSMPAGRVAQALAGSPQGEDLQHASAAAFSQQQHCPAAKGDGEKNGPTQTPRSALVPAGSNTAFTSNTSILGSDTEQLLSGTAVPRTSVTGESNGESGIQVAAGHVRRPSYMRVQARRPTPFTRGSVQVSMPPAIAESGPETESQRAASNDHAIKRARAAAAPEEECKQLVPEEGLSLAEIYQKNTRRQHSTPNLVSMRYKHRQLSVELFAEDDSDDSSSGSRSSGTIDEENAGVEDGPNKVEDPLSWQQSEEGKARIAQLTKATVAKGTPAAKMSRKYLKLFAPSNSVRSCRFRFVFVHRTSPLLLLTNYRKNSLANHPQVKVIFSLPALVLSSSSVPPFFSTVRAAASLTAVGSPTPTDKHPGKKDNFFLLYSSRGAKTRPSPADSLKPAMQHESPDSTAVALLLPIIPPKGTIYTDPTVCVGFSTFCIQGPRHLQGAGDRAPNYEWDRVATKGGLGFLPCSSV